MSWAPDYCTTTDLSSYLRVDDGIDDVQMGLAITAASRAIDITCRRQFGKVASLQARYYTPRVFHDGRFVVDVADLQDVTGMTVATDTTGDGTYATTVTTFTNGPVNAVAEGWPFTQVFLVSAPLLPNSVKITALWGWSAVPDTIRQACLLQASRFLVRRDSPYGVTGSPDNGGELRLLSKVDPDVAVMLRPYVARWWAV